jgi:hypothetical protein
VVLEGEEEDVDVDVDVEGVVERTSSNSRQIKMDISRQQIMERT